MNFIILFTMAFQALLRNKSRSLLTTLGIVIGVGAVILLTSIGSGLQKYIEDQFESLGANTLFVMPYEISDSIQGGVSSTVRGFNSRDLRNIARLGDSIVKVVPMIEKMSSVSYRGKVKTKRLIASQADYIQVRSISVEKGRFFTDGEEKQGRKVAVIGPEVVTNLLDGAADSIGKNITIGSSSFKIIGVMEKKGGGGLGPNVDDVIYLPLTTTQRLFNSDTFDMIMVKLTDTESISRAKKAIEKKLSETREKDEYSVIDQAELLKTINNIIGVLTAGIGGIAAISLLVGGIGIMNIMLVSVTERTREIGLRKAIGATPNIILIQFLIESVVLSLLGGIIGVGLGMGGSLILNKFFPSSVTFLAVGLAFGVSVAVGVIFGILPARRAARLSPINALRYE